MITLVEINSVSARMEKLAKLVNGSIKDDDDGVDIECGVKVNGGPSSITVSYHELIHGDGTNQVTIIANCSAPHDKGDSWLMELEIGERKDDFHEPEITLNRAEYHGFPVAVEDAHSNINELINQAMQQVSGSMLS